MYTIELNSAKKDINFAGNKIKSNSPVVEIFSAMTQGKEISSYGKKADKAVEYIKNLGERSANGDYSAIAELNTIKTFIIEPALLQEIKLLSFFGTYTPLGFDESIEAETYSHEGEKSRLQASNGDVTFPIIKRTKYAVTPQTISGGYACDYRRVQLGDMSKENEAMEQVRIDIRNKAAKYVVDTVYAAIKNATGVKYLSEASGLTKSALDDVITGVRRWGKPSIIGDYAVVSKINAFVGWSDGATTPYQGISQTAMDEIRKTGLLSFYNGSPIVEIPNPYDVTTLDTAGTNFSTLFPAGLLFVAPQNVNSPIRTWTQGGLTSFTGNDVVTGNIITRYDLSVACDLSKGQEYKIGVVKDTSL